MAQEGEEDVALEMVVTGRSVEDGVVENDTAVVDWVVMDRVVVD